jgi:hypothetical protein
MLSNRGGVRRRADNRQMRFVNQTAVGATPARDIAADE